MQRDAETEIQTGRQADRQMANLCTLDFSSGDRPPTCRRPNMHCIFTGANAHRPQMWVVLFATSRARFLGRGGTKEEGTAGVASLRPHSGPRLRQGLVQGEDVRGMWCRT